MFLKISLHNSHRSWGVVLGERLPVVWNSYSIAVVCCIEMTFNDKIFGFFNIKIVVNFLSLRYLFVMSA